MPHTFDPANAPQLEDPGRYRFCSRDELVDLLDVDGVAVAADLGSGTGFYVRDVAPHVDTLYGVDVQRVMHAKFEERAVPENVELVTAAAADLPIADGRVDVVYSTMTYHEFAGTGAMAEVTRILADGGRFVAVDWTAGGQGEAGPPLGERLDLAAAIEYAEGAGLAVELARERLETFVVTARHPT